jgi:hypothetical protein
MPTRHRKGSGQQTKGTRHTLRVRLCAHPVVCLCCVCLAQVRDMVGNNPIVLVGTKMDLLPVGCSPKDVAAWLTEAAARRRLMVSVCVGGGGVEGAWGGQVLSLPWG